MSDHSGMLESLAKDRHTSRYHQCDPDDGSRADSRTGSMDATRSRAGWLLVAIGLRLALHGDQRGSHRTTTLVDR